MYPDLRGTGASAIYPLLGTSERSNWRYIATECDESSFEFAVSNVSQNRLSERIEVLKTDEEAPFLVPSQVFDRPQRLVLYFPGLFFLDRWGLTSAHHYPRFLLVIESKLTGQKN